MSWPTALFDSEREFRRLVRVWVVEGRGAMIWLGVRRGLVAVCNLAYDGDGTVGRLVGGESAQRV